jgi:hypothetical protein
MGRPGKLNLTTFISLESIGIGIGSRIQAEHSIVVCRHINLPRSVINSGAAQDDAKKPQEKDMCS